MAVSLSAREVDEIRPLIEKIADKILGHCDTTILSAISASLRSGHEKSGLQEKLSQYLDKSDARKLSERIFDLIKLRFNSRKRTKDENGGTGAKKRKEEAIPEPGMPSPGQLTAMQIKDMMASAQRVIEERKKALLASGIVIGPPAGNAVTENQRRAQESQSEMSTIALSTAKAKIEQIVQAHQAGKPTAVKVDDSGKVVDASGNEIKIPTHTPTLKANIRARRREEFKQTLQEKPPVEDASEKFFDSRVRQKPLTRQKKGFQFHEKGKFVKEAQAIRMKAKLEMLQGEISQIARKTGITSATTLALTAAKRPDRSKEPEIVPDVEWWDAVILKSTSYNGDDLNINKESITNLIEHPIQMNPPLANLQPGFLPVFLTKKERKKLRRTTRREAWKEKQEKIRLGLDAPPEPKLRISNFMRALTTEATLDPTKIEAHVRAQMAKRQAQHEAANQERALTAEQKKEKKIKKYTEDTSVVVHVAVYRLKDLNNPARKYKIETNAKQLHMTGVALLFNSVNVVVVEGGPKQQKKYKRLMLDRIKWTEDTIKDRAGNQLGHNACHLVWEGTVKERAFGPMQFKLCPSEAFAREFMRTHGVEQYWDLSYSGAMLEATQED